MTRLAQLYDLLTAHGTLSYGVLGSMMGQTQKQFGVLMRAAVARGMACNVAPNLRSGAAQLTPGAQRPAEQEARLSAGDRHAGVLALLGRHPGGLDRAAIGALLGWQPGTVTARMIELEQIGAVDVLLVAGGRQKVYTVPAALPVPQPGLSARSAYVDVQSLPHTLRSAGRILNALSSDKRADPRYLACQGGYTYSRARQLHAEIMERSR